MAEILMAIFLIMFVIMTIGTLVIGISFIIWSFTQADYRKAYKLVFIDSWKEIFTKKNTENT